MAPLTSQWWTEGRIEATVTHDYVLQQLDSNFHSRLRGQIAFGEGLTDDTYIDWILQRARKIFLILVDIGAPERIFSLVDETYDDSDLPIDSKNAEVLRVSPYREDVFLNWKFINAQARFLVGDILAGQHISFEEDEPVPIEVIGQRPVVSLPEMHQVDRVVLSGAELTEHLRFKITPDEGSQLGSESDIVREVQSLQRFRHEHCVSVYASYFAEDSVHVLFTGVPVFSLRTFLNEKTLLPKKLSKCDQRLQWVNWPNCLANALAWLHSQDQIHGAVRPSNILVNADNQVFLGFFDRYNTLVGKRKDDRSEMYQYSSPEQWLGRPLPVVQAQNVPFSPFAAVSPTAGSHVKRTTTNASKPPPPPPKNGPENATWTSKLYNSISVTDVPRAQSTSSAASIGTTSSSGSSPGNTITPSNLQTVPSRSQQARILPASDVFSLAAITLDIITHLCKRRQTAFIQHRGTTIKNKSTTRPTSLFESAFHLPNNAAQIMSWIDILDTDASKGNDAAFHAVKPMLIEVKQMLCQDPDLRPTASRVADEFFRAINQIDFGATQPHCKILQAPGTIAANPNPTIETTRAMNNHKHISSGTKHSSYSNNSSNVSSHMDEPSTPLSTSHTYSPTFVDTSKPWPSRPQRHQYPNDSATDLIDEMIEDFHFRDVRKGSLPSINSWPSPPLQQPPQPPQQPPPQIPKYHEPLPPIPQHHQPQAENRALNQRLRRSEESDASGLAEMVTQMPMPSPRRINTIANGCNRTYSNSSSGSSQSVNSREHPADGKIPMKKRAFFNFSRNKSLPHTSMRP